MYICMHVYDCMCVIKELVCGGVYTGMSEVYILCTI